jgi:nicotinate-nucleotide pyrophosphorylase
VSKPISIAQYLQKQLVEDAFGSDITDHSWSDADEDQEGAPASASQDHGVTSGVQTLYNRVCCHNCHQLKKSDLQKGTDTGLKPYVPKHCGQAVKNLEVGLIENKYTYK